MNIWPLKVRSKPKLRSIVFLKLLFMSTMENFNSLASEKVTFFPDAYEELIVVRCASFNS